MMTQTSGWLSIRQVAERVGISTQLIRKWEQRYHMPEPRRLPNGYRVYTERDVTQLLSVRALMERGYTVQNAMIAARAAHPVLDEGNRSMSATTDALDPGQKAGEYTRELEVAGATCDTDRVLFTLQKAYHDLGLERFADQVLNPLLTRVGELWRERTWSEYQEHMTSTTVLSFLQRMRSSVWEEARGPLCLCATVPHERHEISLQVLMLRALLQGWRVIYLGSSPAPGAIEKAVLQLEPSLVVLSITTPIPLEEDPELLTKLDRFAARHPRIGFWLGCANAFLATHSLEPTVHLHQTGNVHDIIDHLKEGSPYPYTTF
ncbi:MAG: MerR family transcriptional regulator [Firmicutes bacterium]|nr:MerR family transcriptional regulator [Bacillota bacterium]